MSTDPAPPPPGTIGELPLQDLLRGIGQRVGRLVSSEVDLAKAEAAADLEERLGKARDVGIAAGTGFLGLLLVLVAVVLLLATAVAAWLAALIVAAPFLVGAGIFTVRFRNARTRPPLQATNQTLKDDAAWIRSVTR